MTDCDLKYLSSCMYIYMIQSFAVMWYYIVWRLREIVVVHDSSVLGCKGNDLVVPGTGYSWL